LDLDALAELESENWVWQGAKVLRPGHSKALVLLSRGGSDAAVVREFDLRSREFVPDGFQVPEAKTYVEWIDPDRVYVGTDFGEGSLTTSGYPRIAKEWRRGEPLSEASTVYEAKPDDMSTYAFHDPTPGWERDLVTRQVDFYRSECFLRTPDGLAKLDVPDDAEIDVYREWLLIHTRSPWTAPPKPGEAAVEFPAGALLAARFDDYLAGARELAVLFQPTAGVSLNYHVWTQRHLIIVSLADVTTQIQLLTPPEGAAAHWRRQLLPITTGPNGADTDTAGESDGRRDRTGDQLVSADVVAADPDSDEHWLQVSGFTRPATLLRGEISVRSQERAEGHAPAPVRAELESVKQAPAFFDTDGMSVRQLFARSSDGTRVPYFVVAPAAPATPGPDRPTLLTGYGGFEVPLTPSYSGVIGRGWLARGGTYVVANIRGGGEYGPQWHQSALRENRLKVYEDFAAVARDLHQRGIATPPRLGIEGGSNGGLLTGVMLTRWPELFGAVVSRVPLLDMRRYHLLLAGASWMSEYGDPDDPDDWAYLREWSPYHNIRPAAERRYPPTLIFTSTRDDRVHPGHARKMVARLRELGHDVRYHENVEGGHGGASNNEQHAFKWALMLDFLWRRLTP
ncbi:MAG: prolyl oligopeptidase family serine peptidase, partial [Micromonosporaceae bacterium]